MKIFKEIHVMHPLYTAKIENGANISVFDGYAVDNDGQKYYPVCKEIDDTLHIIGWCNEAEHMILI